MAKSLRSKAKRTARRAKRETANSAFAIQEAARLDRLNAKLTARTLLEPEPVHNSREDGSDDEEGWYDFDALYDVLGLLPLRVFEQPQKALWQELPLAGCGVVACDDIQGSELTRIYLAAADEEAMVVEDANEQPTAGAPA